MPYIPGTKPVNPGPLARFLPPLEEGTVSTWLADHIEPGAWLLDPFGISPRLAVEAARAGYRVLVTANNPINRFLVEMAANAPQDSELMSMLADLGAARKGDERLEQHLKSLYRTSCANCRQQIQASSFLWRKGELVPFARVYTCPHCEDSGERLVTPVDIEHAQEIGKTAGLHRARILERVAPLDAPDREYAEEALQAYLPRSIYVLATLVNRIDGLGLPKERRRALTALILSACDAGNSLWGHQVKRLRPKQLTVSDQFHEHNIWMALEASVGQWAETSSKVPLEAWPGEIPESGGICLFEGRLKDVAAEVPKQISIKAAIAAIPRPNQAFWTLSALWAGWLWGREAAEPFKAALRRRRYDWGWNATALGAAFRHMNTMLAPETPVFGLMGEPATSFLASTLMAADFAGFDLTGLALRTPHDPVQITWKLARNNRPTFAPDPKTARRAISKHLSDRGEPASPLDTYAAGLEALAHKHALRPPDSSPDDALRDVHASIEKALADAEDIVHFSTSKNPETGLWGLVAYESDSLADRVEIAIVNYLQKKPESIYLEIEDDLYPRFPGLLTPSKGLIYNVLYSYAKREGGMWHLRPEDHASRRIAELEQLSTLIADIGTRLNYTTHKDKQTLYWQENGKTARVFYITASALIGHIVKNNAHPVEQCLLVIPGGRASLAAYKQQRDPALAKKLAHWQIVKFRLLRGLADLPVLNRQTFEEQLASDPVERTKGQLMMF
ncbi:MAG: hypothetical protein Kow002_10930 [Anaerolineales bacterium]